MVRRLSVASLDSGAESPVYGEEPFCGQSRTRRAATRRNLRHVGHRPAQRKMVCKGHPCIYAADGNPTMIAMRPRKRTDAHGREG